MSKKAWDLSLFWCRGPAVYPMYGIRNSLPIELQFEYHANKPLIMKKFSIKKYYSIFFKCIKRGSGHSSGHSFHTVEFLQFVFELKLSKLRFPAQKWIREIEFRQNKEMPELAINRLPAQIPLGCPLTCSDFNLDIQFFKFKIYEN